MSDDDYQRYQMHRNIDRMRQIAERNDPTRSIGYGGPLLLISAPLR